MGVQSGGAFDKIIAMIDDMIKSLREEEADDIAHRDRCENAEQENRNTLADAGNRRQQGYRSLGRMRSTKAQLRRDIVKLENGISVSNRTLKDMLNLRNSEVKNFKESVKDDTDAIALVREAISALSKFYENNKMPLNLAQKGPKYSKSEDEAPETSWSGPDYGGRKSETTGIVKILSMLAEDLEKEIADARSDDADAQDKYEKQSG